MIDFQIEAIGKDAPHPDPHFDTLLRVVGSLTVKIDDRIFLSEQEFTVVELAASFEAWSSLPDETRPPFRYLATESDEPLLEFNKSDGGWTIDSPLKRYRESTLLSREDLDGAIGRFVRRLNELSRSLKCDVKGVIREEAELILRSQYERDEPG